MHSRNAGILLKNTGALVTSFIILPVTAFFQSLRSCSFGDCLLMGNCYYKDLWEKKQKKTNKQTQYTSLKTFNYDK